MENQMKKYSTYLILGLVAGTLVFAHARSTAAATNSKTVNVTVNFKDGKKKIAKSKKIKVIYGKNVSVKSATVKGYDVQKSAKVTLKKVKKNKTVTFSYKKPVVVTVNYKSGAKKVRKSTTTKVNYNKSKRIKAANIKGYKLTNAKSFHLKNLKKNKTITFKYSIASSTSASKKPAIVAPVVKEEVVKDNEKKYTIKVKYMDERKNVLAEKHYTYVKGSKITITAPAIAHFRLTSSATLDTEVKANASYTFNYVSSYTVKKVAVLSTGAAIKDATGNPVAQLVENNVQYGKKLTVSEPSYFLGLFLSYERVGSAAIQTKTVVGDTTVTFKYMKRRDYASGFAYALLDDVNAYRRSIGKSVLNPTEKEKIDYVNACLSDIGLVDIGEMTPEKKVISDGKMKGEYPDHIGHDFYKVCMEKTNFQNKMASDTLTMREIISKLEG
jgi:hypothetical protein